MGDVFKEQIVKRKGTFKDIAIKACLCILAFLLGFAALLFINPMLGVLVWFAAGFGARFLMSFLNVEYEYIFTSGELDIDIIYDQSRRKRVFSGHVKQFEIMAHIDDKNHEGAFNGAQEVRDYSGGVKGLDTYAFLTVHDGKKVKIIFDPNEKMLKAISGVLTRRNLHLRAGVILMP
ncbi:MAG: hypothetical protein FWC89_05645 [Defluviitaleaceae bacterium]|nr:hypothetical protein [Defluviitaleaceae bacterium]